jgi:orotate phosphoribosyltransferase-like protein
MQAVTTPAKRRKFCELQRAEMTYQEIADLHGVSKECVRFLCWRQRDGTACMSHFPSSLPCHNWALISTGTEDKDVTAGESPAIHGNSSLSGDSR